ncbi:MAG: T9SS type A sorting domain-containing protein [Ignavibacteria bacterium]|nr:T9SS type A sorting domain-containing protein [Ignavibacteria bacterium]
MNLKNLFRTLLVLLFFVGIASAQTFYVNNQTGNDANPGSAAQPKLTVASAIIAAPPASTISVAATGINYTEGNITINKALTFTSTGGTPVFVNASLIVTVNTAFTGPYQFVDLTLTAGAVTGASNLTFSGANITRTAGTVDSQINFTAGAHNFFYNGGAAITSGFELPAAANTTNFGNLTTVGAATALTLNESKTMNGILTTAGTLAVGAANTLSINGANAHTVAGNVTGGTLAFTLTGAASVTGNFNLPNITATKSTAGLAVLTLLTNTTIGNISASVNGSVLADNAVTLGALTNTGAGQISGDAATTVGAVNNSGAGNVEIFQTSGAATTVASVSNTGAGYVLLNNPAAINLTVTGAIAQSGAGFVSVAPIAGAGTVSVGGTVTNNPGLTLSALTVNAASNRGVIRFGDKPTTVTGLVTVGSTFTGNASRFYGAGLNTIWSNTGEISFANTNTLLTLTGGVAVSSSSSAVVLVTDPLAASATGASITNNGGVTFANTSGNLVAAGGFNVSSNFAAVTNVTITGNGSVVAGARTTGTVGTLGVRTGAVVNTSSSVNGSTNGDINFAAGTGTFFGTSVTQGPGAAGGDIAFGDHVIDVTGNISNSRTAAGADITTVAATALHANTVGGYIMNSGASIIDINLASASTLTVTGRLENTSTGTISFTGASGGIIAVGGIVISAGNITVPATHTANFNLSGAWTVSGGTLSILAGAGVNVNVSQTVSSPISWTAGTIDFSGRTAVNVGSVSTTIGGALTNPTFTSLTTTLTFIEPIPNVLQSVYIGGANPVYGGPLSVTNGANIPAPIVRFLPTTGSLANLYVLNNVTFNAGVVINSVSLDGVRLNVGKNGIGGGNGNFQNTTGYTTANGGYVMMSGTTAAQTVNAIAPTAGATFGNFGVDNETAGTPDVTFPAGTSVFTSDFYLAEGDVNLANTQFNGTAPNWPTVFRTEGAFVTTAPILAAGTKISVTYYGSDKATALEIPAAAADLWNLTVSTTNGAVAGKGVVTMGGAATVNGTLTVDANQHLYTNGNLLTIAGATAILNGHLVDNGGIEVALANPTGTAFTGTGSVPSLQINNGSLGNSLVLPGLVSDAFGGDNTLNTGDDAFTTYDGNITYQAGADAGSALTVTFSGAGPHFAGLTFADGDVDQTFTLGSAAIMSGNLAQAGGNINLGGFTLTHNGTAPGMTVGGTITNGLLKFVTAATNFTVTGPGTAVIGANFEYADATDNNVAQTFTFLTGSTGNLQINGTLTLSATTGGGDGAQFDIGAGRTLTAGNNVTVGSGSSFLATNGGGTGILLLDAVTAPLVYSTPAASAVANLTVADDVNLTGGIAGSTLTVGTAMIHNAGAIDIGSANLQLGGNYTRTAGTYTGTGYLIWNSAGVWNHGPAVAYPKLQVAAALNIGATGVVTVNDELFLNGFLLTQTTAAVSYLTVGNADGATVQVAGAGNINNAAGQIVPTFVSPTDYLFSGASSVPNTLTWPTAQADDVTLNTNAGQIVTVGASKTIGGNVDLTVGTLQWDSPVTVTLTDGKTVTRRLNASKLDRNTNADATLGGFVAGNINLAYQQTLAADVITTDIEYSIPTTVNNISLLAHTTGAGNTTQVTIAAGAGAAAGYARTIAGTLSMASILNINLATTWTLAQTIPAGSTVNSNAATTWTGGLTVTGTYVNAVGITSTGAITGAGTITNNGTLTLTGLTATGTTNFGAASILNLTGDATLNNLTVPVAPAVTTINTANNLTFTGTLTNAGLNLNFIGAIAQTVSLPGNRTFNNVTLNKTSDQTVTVSGGNVTLQATAPAGVLTLTRGVLTLADPFVITLNPTVAGGFITALGYVRNPANTVDLAHVNGKVGVAVPVNTLGRMEWPVGSATKYRPAAITFTAGNATIAPTTIVVGHFDTTPTGTKNFPVDGGFKFADPTQKLWIAGKAPYYWSFEATTSLGAAQKFDVELQGTNLQRPLENHNDLRIIRRFDGDVAVNGWYLEGAANSYSNAMATPNPGDTVLVVRNIGSVGSAISQKALFTLGLPSLKPVFTAAALAANTVAENAVFMFDFNAQDQDANAATIVYSLQGTVPANATINATTGVFTFSPDYTQGSATPYAFTVRAAKSTDAASYVEATFNVTVTNVNRVPVFTTAGQVATASGKYGAAYNFTYAATDADAETITYTVAIAPVPTGVASISNAFGSVGLFTFTPVFADKAAGPFVITVTATDASGGVTTTATNFTVLAGYDRGDANTNGVVDVTDAIKILEHVVGLGTPLTAEQMIYADANTVTGDGMVGALDASFVLKYIANGNSWGTFKVVATAGSVEFSRLSSDNGVVSLPFAISGTTGVTSIYAEADLNNANIEVGKINLRLPEGWLSATTTENGKVRIAAAGTTAIHDGIFATVEVTLKDKEAAVSILGNAKLNDEISSSLTAKVREIPTEFALSQNYPNPFNPTTTIKFSVAQDAKVNLVIYDMLGQRVRTLVDGIQDAGFYTVRWDGSNEFGSKVASGIYIYRLQAGSFVSTMKMNLMK